MNDTTFSYTRGACEPPLLDLTIGELLQQVAERQGDHCALISRHQQIRWSYRELLQRVDRCARALMACGVDKGDRVGIWSPNNAQWCVTQLATARIGAILVTINPAYRLQELEYALKQSRCNHLIAADRFKGSDYSAMLLSLIPELNAPGATRLSCADFPLLKTVITLGDQPRAGMLNWQALQQRAEQVSPAQLQRRQDSLDCHDPINIQYTSGTTGYPKGATLSHHNILNNGRLVTANQGFDHRDKLVIPVPLYHCFGMVMGNLGCIAQGATMIYPDEAFDPEAVLQAISEEGATALYGVPTMFIALLQSPRFERYDLSTLRTGIMAGAACPVEIMKQVIDRMHMRDVQIAYGMTETSPVSTQTGSGDSIEHRVNSVGRTQPHLESKIIDSSGAVVARGELGELCTRGYGVMLGYWNNPEATAQAIDKDGWMHTGDLAVMDQQGYIRIVGRSKDMVIRGGENIYPREIEEFLYTHPGISDVQVTGVPDAKYGEELVAWVIPRDNRELTAEALQDYCRGRIAHFKIPRYFKFTDRFPMTVTGKIQKFKMREISARELDLT